MASMDIFSQNAFSMVSLTEAIQDIEIPPQTIGAMNLFAPRPVRTTTVAIERVAQELSLIHTSARGAPLDQQDAIKRTIRDFRTTRLAKGDTVYADEIQGIRAFGSETEMQQIMQVVAERQARLLNDLELTHENLRLGALQGIVKDAGGETLYNWYTEMGVSQAGELDFDLDNAAPAAGALSLNCDKVVTQMRQAAKGGWVAGTRCIGLCGTAFWRDLIAHAEVAKLRELQTLYGDQTGLAALLGLSGNSLLEYGGITFMRYWGTDNDSTVAVDSNSCKFFPMNSPGTFVVAYSPAESFEFVNTLGRSRYALLIRDDQRNMWVKPEVYSYPLYLCTRPAMLQRAKRT